MPLRQWIMSIYSILSERFPRDFSYLQNKKEVASAACFAVFIAKSSKNRDIAQAVFRFY